MHVLPRPLISKSRDPGHTAVQPPLSSIRPLSVPARHGKTLRTPNEYWLGCLVRKTQSEESRHMRI
eukprot:1641905-Karenia_brevis.AAC.1